MKNYFPSIDWIQNYKKENLKGDITAGLTVGIMLIPQGMAYAIIAGLPPVYGLYASLLPIIIYAILGTSRQLAVGPVAMDSLLVASGVGALAMGGTEQYISLAILLALMVGILQFLFGIFRLGFLVNFLSKPVISGFTSAAAIIIGLSQLKSILGINIPKSNQVQKIVTFVFQHLHEIHYFTLGLGILSIIVLVLVKKYGKGVPAPLVIVVLGTLGAWLFGWQEMGIKIVGSVPEGLPSFSIPHWTMQDIKDLLPIAFTIALIAFMEAISVAKAVQTKHKEYEVQPNQELIALGLSNVFGSLFSAYPTTGGFSRTAVNDQAGAKTPFASIISASLIALTLLFLTPLFYFLPKVVLASIIIVAVAKLVDFNYAVFLWKTKKEEFLMLFITFILTLMVGITFGIGIGVVISLGLIIFRTTQPHIAELGKIPNSNQYRNITRFNDVEERNDLLIIRFDSQLYFANTQYFKDELLSKINRKEQVEFVVIKSDSISGIDITALQMLEELVNDLKVRNIQLVFSGVTGPVRDMMAKSGFMERVGENAFFLDVQFAVRFFDQNIPCSNKDYVLQVKK